MAQKKLTSKYLKRLIAEERTKLIKQGYIQEASKEDAHGDSVKKGSFVKYGGQRAEVVDVEDTGKRRHTLSLPDGKTVKTVLAMDKQYDGLDESLEMGITDTEKVKAEETDADEIAGSLAKDVDFIKALKIEEARLTKRLGTIREMKSRVISKISKDLI